MSDDLASVLDLVLLVAVLCIGAVMVSDTVIRSRHVLNPNEQSDKTAIVNYTGDVDVSFDYTKVDMLLSLCVTDRYTPNPCIVYFPTGDFTVDMSESSVDTPYGGYNFISADRLTAIRCLWTNPSNNLGWKLRTFMESDGNVVKLELKKEGGLKWYVTVET